MLEGYHLTLSILWPKYHYVKIDFASNSLAFESEYCLKNCINNVTIAYGIEDESPHFLRAYAALSALGHKVLDKDEVLQILHKYYHEFFLYSSRKQKINCQLTRSLIMRYHSAMDSVLFLHQYMVLAHLSYRPCTNG